MSFGQYSLAPKPPKPDFPKPANRMKHVFDNPAHVWAHRLQKDGSGFEQTDARVGAVLTAEQAKRVAEEGQ